MPVVFETLTTFFLIVPVVHFFLAFLFVTRFFTALLRLGARLARFLGAFGAILSFDSIGWLGFISSISSSATFISAGDFQVNEE